MSKLNKILEIKRSRNEVLPYLFCHINVTRDRANCDTKYEIEKVRVD
jgi:hypothetical protein